MSEHEDERDLEAEAEERRRQIRLRAARLAAIAEHPEWPEVVAEAERYASVVRRRVTDAVWAGDTLSEAEIAYARGQVDGYLAFVQTPGNAAKKLAEMLEAEAEDERQAEILRLAESEMLYG